MDRSGEPKVRELTKEELEQVLYGYEPQGFDPVVAQMAMGQLYMGSYFDVESPANVISPDMRRRLPAWSPATWLPR